MGQGGHVYGTGLKGWGFKRFRAPPYPSSGRPRLWDGIDGVRFVNGFHTPGVWVKSSGQLAGRFK